MQFELLKTEGRARRGRLVFERGVVETPAFMPVGTYGTVKGMTPEEIKDSGAHICLGNTFHLMLRPGTGIIRQHGDLHDFMNWDKPILTDSGGFQVFSLGDLRKITEEGVTFRSPINGEKILLTPEKSMEVQRDLGSDIVMIFDECTPYPASEAQARESMALSLRWAARSKSRHGDIAGALSRVTGLSVVGNGFVYVRGLGDRYSLALLNGSPLPSPEPLKRVVPLDLFPTGVVASSLVQKSYSVNYPGEFGGGVINLTTRAVPDESFFTISVSGGDIDCSYHATARLLSCSGTLLVG